MINRIFRYIFNKLFYLQNFLNFRSLSFQSTIISPLRIDGKKNITIEKGVVIQNLTWLAAVPIQNNPCRLFIGEGTVIGNFNHIYATQEITIGKNVLTADKVYISDNQHEYENINLPILKQEIKQLSKVNIGDGTWLGENVCVIGASIGKNCVIGANSVVTKDIPDYCVAVGAPAKVIKKYNSLTKQWEKV